MKTGLLLLLQLVSLTGLFIIPKKYFKINFYFCPLFIICVIYILLLFGGCIGLLFETSCLIYVLGYISLIVNFKEYLDKKMLFSIIVYVAAIVAIYFFKVRYFNLLDMDDYIVWGSRVKAMLLDNQLPDYEDLTFVRAIRYGQSTGLWIYYFCRFIKNYESLYLLAQQIILVSCIFSLVPTLKKATTFKIIVFILFVIYLLVTNNSFHNLCVDSLMSLICIAGISVVLEEKNNREFVLTIMIIFLSQLKKNAIYFVFVLIVFYVLFNKEYSLKKKIIIVGFQFILPMVFINTVYNYYVQSLYNANIPLVTQISSNKTVGNSFNIIHSLFPTNKTFDQCLMITSRVIKNSFNFTYKRPAGMISIIFSMLIVIFSSSLRKNKECVLAVISIFVIYLGYVICSVYAYIVLFGDEAILLPSFDRYLLSSVEVSVAIGILYSLKSDEINIRKKFISIALLLLLLNHNGNLSSLIPHFSYPSDLNERDKFKNMLKDISPDKNNSFLVIDIDWFNIDNSITRDYSFNYHSVLYDLWTDDYEAIKDQNKIAYELEHWTEWRDYLIIDTPTYETNVYLESIGRGDLIWQEYVLISAKDVMQ